MFNRDVVLYTNHNRAEKRGKLRKLLCYDHSRLIRRGIVKQATHLNKLASCYFPHMSGVRAGGDALAEFA
jgi:hypothetical protein